MQKKKDGIESGRSMVEMFGVLALIGVLSIGGIVGYGYAMRLYQEAELLDALSVTVAGGRSWDIPLHYGDKTVGVGDNYVPYVVPIREVVSKVNYRSASSAFDEGMVDETGTLITGVSMYDVREHESFDGAFGVPVWVRAEDDIHWSVRITGLSYSLCEKILSKNDLGFTHAYVALQDGSGNPLDPSLADFNLVDNTDKYMNADQFEEEDQDENMVSRDRIEAICSEIDPQKSNVPLIKTYIDNIDNPETKLAGIRPGSETSECQNKKSLRCLASGARVYNPETEKVDMPLQTLVLYFGKGGEAIAPESTCVAGTPFTEESGGLLMSEECCLILDSTYYRNDIKQCCRMFSGDAAVEPHCVMRSDGFYAVDIDCERDSSGNPLVPTQYVTKERLINSALTSDDEIYFSPEKWNGSTDAGCCDAVSSCQSGPTSCHQSPNSSAFSNLLPWAKQPHMGTTATQYQNCPHRSATLSSPEMTKSCCEAAGDYWAVKAGKTYTSGNVETSAAGEAFCCSKDSVIRYTTPASLEQCAWDRYTNVPTTPSLITGAIPMDILGGRTPNCCFKTKVRAVMKDSACTYEGGVLKYSSECCNASTNMMGENLIYVQAPYQAGVSGYISQECGFVVGEPSVPEPDRNCCVNYSAIETKRSSALPSSQNVLDWAGFVAPEYCCETLIGTKNGTQANDVKTYYKECCEANLYTPSFNGTISGFPNHKLNQKGVFVDIGTEIKGYNIVSNCSSPLTGQTCSPYGAAYTTTTTQCCNISNGKAMDGTENKVCCEYASMTTGNKMYWDGMACVGCPKCSGKYIPNIKEKCLEYCTKTIIEPVLPEEVCNPPCFKVNNACCISAGYRWDGGFSIACCPPTEEFQFNDFNNGAFRAKDAPTRIDGNPECVTSTELLPAPTEKTQVNYSVVTCKNGDPAGTSYDMGKCP